MDRKLKELSAIEQNDWKEIQIVPKQVITGLGIYYAKIPWGDEKSEHCTHNKLSKLP